MIKPHGGVLINRVAQGKDKEFLLEKMKSAKKIKINDRQASDIEMISFGAFSPLEGFLNEKDYRSVISTLRLSSGIPWTMPVNLALSEQDASVLKSGEDVLLYEENTGTVAMLSVEDVYHYDKEKESTSVFGTTDEKHPGVRNIYEQGSFYVGGKVTLLLPPKYAEFNEYRIYPEAVRRLFNERKYSRVAGFQTRNPIHRAHEYIIKCALEITDSVMIHPVVGTTKSDDIPADVRMKCYEVLIEKYFPKDRAVLVVNPAYMRYGGPREAVFHAIIRKNYGCTHFIVGRDHAGVGNYYGPYDAQKIFSEFAPGELEIQPLFFENSFWCDDCEGMASVKTCPHADDRRLNLSGTKVREMLKAGKQPPREFTRPEIADILIDWVKTV